jgi:hypothetical protein
MVPIAQGRSAVDSSDTISAPTIFQSSLVATLEASFAMQRAALEESHTTQRTAMEESHAMILAAFEKSELKRIAAEKSSESKSKKIRKLEQRNAELEADKLLTS